MCVILRDAQLDGNESGLIACVTRKRRLTSQQTSFFDDSVEGQGKRTAAVATPPSLTFTERTLRPC